MQIVSWNMWVKNTRAIKNLQDFLRDYPADVYCLQEVTAEVLTYIQDQNNHDFDYVYSFDYRKFKHGYYQNYYLVILSRHPIKNTKLNRIHVNHLTRESLWDWLMRWDESIEFQYADIEVKGTCYRIFNCHLELSAGPEVRMRQFEQCVEKFLPDGCNVVCGDFNIFANPHWNWFLWWAFGFKWREIKINEREIFEKRFAELELQNPFLDQATFYERNLQLDHILVPSTYTVETREVIKNSYGSDHQPIWLTLASA